MPQIPAALVSLNATLYPLNSTRLPCSFWVPPYLGNSFEAVIWSYGHVYFLIVCYCLASTKVDFYISPDFLIV